MSWFSRLLGRDTGFPVEEEGHFAISSQNRRSTKIDADLPSFRASASRIGRRFDGSPTHDSRARIRDAFTPSQPVNDRGMFAGRRGLIEDLIVAIEDQRLHFVIYGDRGIGKTSILHLLSELAVDADYLVCYISCGERTSFSDFARRIAHRIPLLFHDDYTAGSAEIEQGMTLADILPPTDFDVSTFGEVLGRLSDTRVLILLDEFDRVETEDFRRSIAELIKTLSDNGAPAQIVIAGVAPDLSGLISQIPSIRRNVLGMLVPNMTDDEVSEMLTIAERRAGLSFNADARELIALASLGLPYLVGLVAQHAALIATGHESHTISKADVRDAIRKARAELGGRIAARTLHTISEAAKSDQLVELGKLAHAALRSGGTLPTELMKSDSGIETGERGHISDLIEQIEDDPLHRWRFKDDGASVYIWLSALCAE